jgi:S-adenosylmethionine:tRNA ribosyltransferase-isomerase
MKSQDYTYNLPDDRIAKFPVEPRDSSKLLFYKEGEISHQKFTDLPNLLPENTFLVFNDTKVIPARLHFKRATGAIIEVFLLNPIQPTTVVSEAMLKGSGCTWSCMIGNRKKWKPEEKLSLQLAENWILTASLPDYTKNEVLLEWNNEANFLDIVQAAGEIPLPPYLNRATELHDLETYQTVYSLKEGAVAAPTAGLHFTSRTFDDLAKRNIKHGFVTLHVGAGTFQPIKVDNILDHPMHNEQVLVNEDFIEEIIPRIGFLIPVGTTSMRTLESLYWFGVKALKGETDPLFVDQRYAYQHFADGISTEEALTALLAYMKTKKIKTLLGTTEIFIHPGYQMQVCRGIITNFHQPESTLMLLVAALVGSDWQQIYAQALEHDYRFLSYGDSSLLLP